MANEKEVKEEIKTFLWKRWICPLGRNSDSEYIDEDDEEGLTEYEKMEEDKYKGQRLVPNMVMTSFGLVPIYPFNNPARAFKWWVLHTGFNLTSPMLDTVNQVLGVEIMEPFSSLELRIAVGQCFMDKYVKKRVEQSLLGVLNPGKGSTSINEDKGKEAIAETI